MQYSILSVTITVCDSFNCYAPRVNSQKACSLNPILLILQCLVILLCLVYFLHCYWEINKRCMVMQCLVSIVWHNEFNSNATHYVITWTAMPLNIFSSTKHVYANVVLCIDCLRKDVMINWYITAMLSLFSQLLFNQQDRHA